MMRESAVTEVRLSEYNAIAHQQEEFDTLLNEFTAELLRTGFVDQKKLNTLSEYLVREYSKIGAFAVNVSDRDENVLDSYQTSLNRVKSSIQTFSGEPDVDPLLVALEDMYRHRLMTQAILQRAAGKPINGG
ncbi:hypothetical protein ACSSV1_004056 [Labrenzia sp. MBR-25]